MAIPMAIPEPGQPRLLRDAVHGYLLNNMMVLTSKVELVFRRQETHRHSLRHSSDNSAGSHDDGDVHITQEVVRLIIRMPLLSVKPLGERWGARDAFEIQHTDERGQQRVNVFQAPDEESYHKWMDAFAKW